MLKVFIGYDHRQPIAYTVLQHSILKHASKPVSITPLVLDTLPIKRQGLTPFTYSRFLVPYLCNYEGCALFLDIDMLLLDDISKLFACFDEKYAVQVSKNEKRFEWASAILFNNEKCRKLTPDYIENAENNGLHRIEFVDEKLVGEFPSVWNHLVGYDKPQKAKLIHYTQGIPCHPELEGCEYSKEWNQILQETISSASWQQLMGPSVHATTVNGKRVPRLSVEKP